MDRFIICKTSTYSVQCIAGKPLPTVIDVIKAKAASYQYNKLTKFIVDGKVTCCCDNKAYKEMTITGSTFELTRDGAVENGVSTVAGKNVSVMRIWEFCSCLNSYIVDSVIVFTVAEAPKAEAPKAEAPKAEAPKEEKEEEEEEDLFGDDDDEEEDEEAAAALQAKMRAEAEKKKGANKKIEKSLIVIDVKPYDADTDLEALFVKIQKTEVAGCKWSETRNICPLAYGVFYLQLSCVIEDEICCEDDVIDAITQFDDEVQSTEVASFNKIS